MEIEQPDTVIVRLECDGSGPIDVVFTREEFKGVEALARAAEMDVGKFVLACALARAEAMQRRKRDPRRLADSRGTA